MRPFNVLFEEAHSDEITYNGKKVIKHHTLSAPGKYKIHFKFISVSSKFDQAIDLHLCDFKGTIHIDGKKVNVSKSSFPQIIIEHRYSPKKFEMEINLESGDVLICNASDSVGDGTMWDSLYDGCAMMVKELGKNKYRFYCNDHECDDDFNDLIFEMKIQNIDDGTMC